MADNLTKDVQIADNHVDDHVDEKIKRCFDVSNSNNFFMFAGAGSGKTRSLINALLFLDSTFGEEFFKHAKQIAVITYTNAACDEILRRLQYKSLFTVSTIHSFLWELIKPHQTDIKVWVEESIKEDICKLEEQQRKGRGGKAAQKRAEEIKRKSERLNKLATIECFSYNPNGDNVGNDSLNHSEVIKMGSEFIATEETMQDILVGKFPILLIDESQDTKRELVDALLSVCEKQDKRFIVGMFGDTMQRIYTDGKENLADCIPNNWDKPAKVMNHRSTKRIVALANAVRSTIDNQSQQARSDADTGIVRLFITSSSNKEETEQQIAEMMASVTGDNNWCDETGYKSLILEHHMAASRFGFSDLYIPLKEPDVFGTALLDGTIPELSLLVHKVLPLIKAYQNNDEFGVSKIVRQHSPLLDKKLFVDCDDQIALLRKAESAINDTLNLWKNDVTPSCVDILRSLKKTGLFKLSSRVDRILDSEAEDSSDVKAIALRTALAVDLDELERYHDYVTDKTRFATHQGVKGLEFPRVMVIMDDADSRGFLFSYEKLFGAKAKTETDIKNEREGKDTSISRTTRLFYVACTRAQNSLAVVAYTESVEATKETALSNGWFAEDEIILLN